MWQLSNISIPSTLKEAREINRVTLWCLGEEFRELNKNRQENLQELSNIWEYIKKEATQPDELTNDYFVFRITLRQLAKADGDKTFNEAFKDYGTTVG